MTISADRQVTSTPEKRRDTILESFHLLAPVVAEALDAKDWEYFGYDSWAAYCEAELGSIRLPRLVRRDAAVLLRSAGMQTRAIADALRVSHTTIERDLAVGTDVPTEQPTLITPIHDNSPEQPKEMT